MEAFEVNQVLVVDSLDAEAYQCVAVGFESAEAEIAAAGKEAVLNLRRMVGEDRYETVEVRFGTEGVRSGIEVADRSGTEEARFGTAGAARSGIEVEVLAQLVAAEIAEEAGKLDCSGIVAFLGG